MNARVNRFTHKYGIEVPRTFKEVLAFDDIGGNHLWQDVLDREIPKLRVSFDILDKNKHYPPGYSKSSVHIIFDFRMTLERKPRWVKYGHSTPEHNHFTYAGIVSLRKRYNCSHIYCSESSRCVRL